MTLLLMAATTLLCGLLPYRLLGRGRQEAGTTLVSLASCFSGGVFIAACLLDLLPETEEKMQQVAYSNVWTWVIHTTVQPLTY